MGRSRGPQGDAASPRPADRHHLCLWIRMGGGIGGRFRLYLETRGPGQGANHAGRAGRSSPVGDGPLRLAAVFKSACDPCSISIPAKILGPVMSVGGTGAIAVANADRPEGAVHDVDTVTRTVHPQVHRAFGGG